MRWIESASARRWLPPAVGLAYGLFYLHAIGDLTLYGPPAWGAMRVDEPFSTMLRARATLMFEPVALLEMGWLVWLVSPLNVLLTVVLAGLLAGNVHGALYLRSQPAACRTDQSGLLAAVPALMAGGACCAPGLLLLLGIPALGALAGLFAWLMPLSVILLGLSRIWQHHRGAPAMFSPWPGARARTSGPEPRTTR